MNAMQAYTPDWYIQTLEGVRRSAREIVPIVLRLIELRSVIDVGCGVGTWLSVFKEHGVIDVLGVDGRHVDGTMLEIPPKQFLAADLSKPFHIARQFDLAVSLEVAEHLPIQCAGQFVESLTRLSPIVLFSAAIPFQGGTCHINEQWPDYWRAHFERHGFVAVDALRHNIWQNEKVYVWYRQNMLLFVSEGHLRRHAILKDEYRKTNTRQLSIVHPELYGAICRNSGVRERDAALGRLVFCKFAKQMATGIASKAKSSLRRIARWSTTLADRTRRSK
jgi:SAM-dependent methyltransferase